MVKEAWHGWGGGAQVRAQEAGGSRCCAAVRCVSCVQSSDMLAEPPNTDATRPWPRGEAGLHRLVGSGSSPLEAKDVCVVGEVRVKAANTCFAVQGGKRRTDEETTTNAKKRERQHGDEEAESPHTRQRQLPSHMDAKVASTHVVYTCAVRAPTGTRPRPHRRPHRPIELEQALLLPPWTRAAILAAV